MKTKMFYFLALAAVVFLGVMLWWEHPAKNYQTANWSEQLSALLKEKTSKELVTLHKELHDSEKNLEKIQNAEALYGLNSFTLYCAVSQTGGEVLSFETDPNGYSRSLIRRGSVSSVVERNVLAKLLTAGLPIITWSEWSHTTTRPILRVDVRIPADACSISEEMNPKKVDADNNSVVVNVSLLDKFALVRKPSLTFYSPIWERSESKDMVKYDEFSIAWELAKALVDELINDYFAANPKEHPKDEQKQ